MKYYEITQTAKRVLWVQGSDDLDPRDITISVDDLRRRKFELSGLTIKELNWHSDTHAQPHVTVDNWGKPCQPRDLDKINRQLAEAAEVSE
jgi:hypothetical protein